MIIENLKTIIYHIAVATGVDRKRYDRAKMNNSVLNITLQLVHCVHLTLIYCVCLVSVLVLVLEVFSVAAPTIWNSLPLDIRNSCSIASFNSKLSFFQPLAIFSAPPHPSASDSASFSPTILCAL